MRVNFFSQTGNINTGLDKGTTGTLTGPLVLAGNPMGPLEAAPKQYVDTVMSALNANNIKAGTLNAGRLPGFTGEVSSATGSGIFILNETGVPAGTYTKVTVNAKGRVISATNIGINDIPPFSWSKITNDKPTTLSGYGITDAISKQGGVLQGNITQNGTITGAFDAVTKIYIDNIVAGTASNSTGNIIRRPTAVTPTGYLRCNGGEVSKTTYSALYSIVGDQFGNFITPGAGFPTTNQFNINSSTTLPTDNFGYISEPSPYGRTGASVTIVKNKVYMIGGTSSDETGSTDVYYCDIDANGNLGPWIKSSQNFPTKVTDHGVVVTSSRIYVLLGLQYISSPNVYFGNNYYATINADGTLGTWTLDNSLSLYSTRGVKYVVDGNTVFAIGGFNYSYLDSIIRTIKYATIDANGVLGSFNNSGTQIPVRSWKYEAIKSGNYCILIGGYNYDTLTLSPDIYYISLANLKSATAYTWTKSTIANNLPASTYMSAVVSNSKLYIFALSSSNYNSPTSGIYTCSLDANGLPSTNFGTYNSGVSLCRTNLIKTTNYLYAISGYNSYGTCSRTMYRTAIDASGTITTTWTKYDFSSDIGNQSDQIYNLDSFIYKNKIYNLMTVVISSTPTTYLKTTNINSDGTMSGTGWTTLATLSTGIYSGKMVIFNNYIYILGVAEFTNNKNVYYATLNNDGSVGTFSTTTALPSALYGISVFINNGNSKRIYALGGTDGTIKNTCYYATINANGTLGSWTLDTVTLPYIVYNAAIACVKNKVYLFGGNNNSGYIYTTAISTIGSDGKLTTWTSGTTIPYGCLYYRTIVTNKYLYLIGQQSSSSSGIFYVLSAPVNADGTLGSFVIANTSYVDSANYNMIMNKTSLSVTSSKVYLFNGPLILVKNFNGGLNDYTNYYNNSMLTTDPANFVLPDFTTSETSSEYYFIKY